MGQWQEWIGRSHVQSEQLTPALVRRHRATLDLSPDDPAPLAGIHWCLNLPEAASAELGEDGHPRRAGLPAGKAEEGSAIAGSFLPPIPMPRRMWAASETEFLAPIPVGATVTRTSTIAAIEEKQGSSGALAFVTLDHALSADGLPVVREKQTLVYREPAIISDAAPSAPAPERTDDGLVKALKLYDHQRKITPDEALLFRFSALTFNTHRIHYDAPYATGVEGYRGIVVHGPLTATLLLNWAGGLYGPIRRFTFRAVSPAIAGEPLTLGAREESGRIILAAHGPDGRECVKASAEV
jgi:3-methylfumaryl-CoA hydratase